MNASTKYRRVSDVLARFMLIGICFLLSGCDSLTAWFCSKVESNYPATVLLADKVNESKKIPEVVVNLDEIRIGDDPLAKILPKSNYWRVSAFLLENLAADAIADSGWVDYSGKIATLKDIPVEQLLKIDFDLILEGTKEKPTKVHTTSFTVLFHLYPEHKTMAQNK